MKTINPPGIFNDALGPVMRGPSSSHTAGSHRIGKVLQQLAGSSISKVTFQFHSEGSLATTYHTQGSDIGLAAGIIGIPISDATMPTALEQAREQGIDLVFEIKNYSAKHPNTYRCIIETTDGECFQTTALSTGGGLIEFIELAGFELNIQFDLPCMLLHGKREDVDGWWIRANKEPSFRKQVFRHQIDFKDDEALLIIEFNISQAVLPELNTFSGISRIIDPVYPVMGYAGSLLPFLSASDLEEMPELSDSDLGQLALKYESKRSGLTETEVHIRMKGLVDIFMAAIDTGLAGTTYKDRIAHAQSPEFLKRSLEGKLLPAGPLEKMTAYIMAIMESKSAMELIVAAPTAGAAGGLPGAILSMAEETNANRDQIIEAFLAAGLIGVFISREATFAAEVAGCQAETGSGAAMAAAGMIQLAGGNAKDALGAASIALQNVMGLVCDPVANRVEIPCLSRNVQAGANALISANMILGGVDPVIPLSESITTMLKVGKALPRELRCTALGGLSISNSAKKVEDKLNKLSPQKD
ncbi:MAG: serine dehydratase [Bacteroidetes bacterium]|jgi:L-serine dehydratase|nr:serine dehydratase [Bacteroidota bacterium]MBT3750160.1 serine dehydratase [Bacteroidota bacterium]MBT4399835.1 serine dehydratase [Bacteroidota bacterium]MBT4410903.1 serine dehydratase [Bacteroidota bacterium]MBT5424906.1 serine dehydratase [Bacteroidota bacterium]